MALTMQQKQAAYRAKNQAKFAAQRAERKATPTKPAAQSLAVKNANTARAAGTGYTHTPMPSEMTPAQKVTKSAQWWGGTKPAPKQDLKFGGDLANVMQELSPTWGGQKTSTPSLSMDYSAGQYGAPVTPSLSMDLTPPKPADSGSADAQSKLYQQPFTQPNIGVFAGQESEDTARYQRELETQQLAETQAQEAYDALKTKYAGETDEALKRWDADAEGRYQVQLDQAQENMNRTTEEMMRFKGAKGTTRSSRTMDAMSVIQDKGNQIKQSLLAERDRERELHKAQLAGLEGDALAPYAQAVQTARETRMGTEAVLQMAKQGLLIEQQQASEEVKMQEQQRYLDYLKEIGMAQDPRTGETVESMQGMLDRSKAGKDTASGQKYLLEAQKLQKALDNKFEVKFTKDGAGNSLAVWFDPTTPGEMQTALIGEAAPVRGGGGGGGGGGGAGGGVVPSGNGNLEGFLNYGAEAGNPMKDWEKENLARELATAEEGMNALYESIKPLPYSYKEQQDLMKRVQAIRKDPGTAGMNLDRSTYDFDPNYLSFD